MEGKIYKNPILFAIIALIAVSIGTIVTTIYPMFTPQMHPKLENLRPYTALQLAGRDVYMREGCHYCHTQTVRPLKAEVMRYGEYSKAGEFAYDHPFLWGSKRTGPDLARIGGKYPDEWHYRHMENPKAFFKETNMPSYAFLKERKLNPQQIKRRMKALGFPYTEEDIVALKDKTEMDALVAYLQVIGSAVKKAPPVEIVTPEIEKEAVVNPLIGKQEAIERGKRLYEMNCAVCHGAQGQGGIGPSLADDVFLYVKGDLPDYFYFEVTSKGTAPGMVIKGRTAKGGMPPFGQTMSKDDIWSIVAYIRTLQKK